MEMSLESDTEESEADEEVAGGYNHKAHKGLLKKLPNVDIHDLPLTLSKNKIDFGLGVPHITQT